MSDEVVTARIEVHLTTTPPAARLASTAGVSEVAVSGTTFTCVISGSFQPLLESLQGYEVVHLRSSPQVSDAA